MSDNATCSNCGRDENLFDNSYGEHFCVDVPECAAVCAEQRDAAKAEAQQWQNELAIYKLTENERVKHLESWKESVLAEVGESPHHSTPWKQMVDHYKHRAEHLAAKLLEAQSCQVSTTRALQAAERIAITAHECWDKDQDYKVGKLLLAMIRNDLKYSDDCTIFRMGIQAIDGQPAPNPIEISRELFDAATGALAPKSGEQSNG